MLVQSSGCTLHLVHWHVDEKYWPAGHLLSGLKQLAQVAVSSVVLPWHGFCSHLFGGQDAILQHAK